MGLGAIENGRIKIVAGVSRNWWESKVQ